MEQFKKHLIWLAERGIHFSSEPRLLREVVCRRYDVHYTVVLHLSIHVYPTYPFLSRETTVLYDFRLCFH